MTEFIAKALLEAHTARLGRLECAEIEQNKRISALEEASADVQTHNVGHSASLSALVSRVARLEDALSKAQTKNLAHLAADVAQATDHLYGKTRDEWLASPALRESALAQLDKANKTSAEPENCGTCKFWFHVEGEKPVTVSRCRRYPPINVQKDETFGVFPLTDISEWCGVHKPRKARNG